MIIFFLVAGIFLFGIFVGLVLTALCEHLRKQGDQHDDGEETP
jgi:hypothetical protein